MRGSTAAVSIGSVCVMSTYIDILLVYPIEGDNIPSIILFMNLYCYSQVEQVHRQCRTKL